MKRFVPVFFVVMIFIFCFTLVACAAGVESYTTLKTKYANGVPIRILLVPGHDNEFYGTSFDGVREADLNLQLAQALATDLSKDPKIQVTLARDQNGYNPDFSAYFNANSPVIMQGVADKAALIQQAIQSGELIIPKQVPHVDAAATVVDKLYTLNSWIDEQAFDLVLHIHFNDYGSRSFDKAGKYSGFAVYVPDTRLLNATTSLAFGDAIGARLAETLYKSDQPSEKKDADKSGAIPDFYLIAMGAYNSVAAPRALVEYSYIYESQLQGDFFTTTAEMLARSTASGITDFLVGKKVAGQTNLSYNWPTNLSFSKTVSSSNILALQYGLSELGFFPPKNTTRFTCPFTGTFGNCTKKSLIAFQASHNINPTGFAGPITRQLLNKIFAEQ